MNLENTLSEISQTQKHKDQVMPLIWVPRTGTFVELESKIESPGAGKGWRGEMGVFL